MSTKTGTAPRSAKALAVETKVNDGMITSSPGRRSSSSAAISRAWVHEGVSRHGAPPTQRRQQVRGPAGERSVAGQHAGQRLGEEGGLAAGVVRPVERHHVVGGSHRGSIDVTRRGPVIGRTAGGEGQSAILGQVSALSTIVRAERCVGRLVDSRWTVAGRGRGGVPAAAARADPADPGGRGRVRPGRPGLGPAAGQPVRRLLRRPPAAADRAVQGVRRDRRAAVHPGRRARSPARALVVAAAAVARLVADEHAARWTAVAVAALSTNVADRRGGGEGRAARAAGADGQPLALAAWRCRDRSWRGRRWRRAAGRAGPRASSRTWSAAWSSPPSCSSARALGRAADPGRARPARRRGRGRRRRPGAGHGRLGARGRRTAAHALVRRLRLPLRRRAACCPARPTPPRPCGPGCWSLVAVGAGMLLIIGGFVVHIRGEWARRRAAHRRGRRDAGRRPRRAGAGRQLLARLPLPAAPGHRAVRGAAGPAREPARRGDAGGDQRRGRLDACCCLVGWVGYNASGLQEFDEHDTGVALARGGRARRHPRRLRRPRRPPARQRAALAVRASVEPADAHPRPGPRRARGAGRADRTPPTWIVEWVAVRRPGTRTAARAARLVEERYVAHGTGCGGPADLAAARRRPDVPDAGLPRRGLTVRAPVADPSTRHRHAPSSGSVREAGRSVPVAVAVAVAGRRAPRPRASRRSASRS